MNLGASATLYTYEYGGLGKEFTIEIYDDGKFVYSESLLNSRRGVGKWEVDGFVITLFENNETSCPAVNHFKLSGDKLIFTENNSDNFPLVKLKNGEVFTIKPVS